MKRNGCALLLALSLAWGAAAPAAAAGSTPQMLMNLDTLAGQAA